MRLPDTATATRLARELTLTLSGLNSSARRTKCAARTLEWESAEPSADGAPDQLTAGGECDLGSRRTFDLIIAAKSPSPAGRSVLKERRAHRAVTVRPLGSEVADSSAAARPPQLRDNKERQSCWCFGSFPDAK